MDKIKEFLKSNKDDISKASIMVGLFVFVLLTLIYVYFVQALKDRDLGKLSLLADIDEVEQTDSEIPLVDETVNEDLMDNLVGEPQPYEVSKEIQGVFEKILQSLDAIESKKTVGFDYVVDDGDEWIFGATVQEDISNNRLYADVTVNSVSGGYYCTSDCKKIYWIEGECHYYLGGGYELPEPEYKTFSGDFQDEMSKTCRDDTYFVELVKPDFIEWGISADVEGDYSHSFWEYNKVKVETKTIDGVSMTVYTIVNSLDDESGDGWPFDIIARFDKNGNLRFLQFPFSQGHREINFNEFDKVYSIEFPK